MHAYLACPAYLPSELYDVLLFLLFIALKKLMVPFQTNYLRLIFTKFPGLVDLWVEMNELTFLQLIKGRCHGNQFWYQVGEIGLLHFHSSHWHYKTDTNIAMPMEAYSSNDSAAPCKNLASFRPANPRVYEARMCMCTAGVSQYSGVALCSLGGSTDRLGGWHGRFCHAFLVSLTFALWTLILAELVLALCDSNLGGSEFNLDSGLRLDALSPPNYIIVNKIIHWLHHTAKVACHARCLQSHNWCGHYQYSLQFAQGGMARLSGSLQMGTKMMTDSNALPALLQSCTVTMQYCSHRCHEQWQKTMELTLKWSRRLTNTTISAMYT